MKKIVFFLTVLLLLEVPLVACNSINKKEKIEQSESNSDSLNFELTNKTNVQPPSYSVEDEQDTLDDLLGSPALENNTDQNTEQQNIASTDEDSEILDLLEQTIEESPKVNNENAQDTNNNSSSTITEEENTNVPSKSEVIENIELKNTMQRKVPNTGIYPD